MAYSTIKFYLAYSTLAGSGVPSTWTSEHGFTMSSIASSLGESVGATNEIYGYVGSGKTYPHTATAWGGTNTLTVQLNLTTTDSGAEVRCRVSRVNSSGTIQQSGSWTAYQTLASNRTFSVSQPTWTAGSATDYFALEIEAQRIAGEHGNKTVDYNNSSYISNIDIIPATTNSMTLTQKSFRFRNDDGDEGTATYRQAVNTNDTLNTDTNYRIRFLLNVSDQKSFPQVWRPYLSLEYNKNSGGWTDVTTSSSNIKLSDSTNFTDHANILSADISTGSFNWGAMVDNSSVMYPTHSSPFSTNDETEMEICFQVISADVTGGDTIQLRLVSPFHRAAASGSLDWDSITGDWKSTSPKASPTANYVSAYTNTPTITVSGGAAARRIFLIS